MKRFVKPLLLVVLAGIMACGGNKTTVPLVKTDSLPADLAKLSKQIEDNPKDATLYNQRAKYYIDHQQLDKALNDVNRAIALDDKKVDYRLTLSDVYFSGGQITKCEDVLKSTASLYPDNAEPILKLAELYYYKKDYDKTFENTSKALDIDELNAKADFIRGMAYKDLGDTAKAVKCFEKTVEKDQQYFHAYMQLGLLYSKKKSKLAESYFNNALNVNPQSTEALYALAFFYQENEEYNKAIEKYTMIIQLDPKNKNAYYNLGYIHLVYLRVYEEAIKYFSEAIKIDPNYAEALYNRGYCFELLGNVNMARQDYQMALKVKTNYQRAIDGLNRLDKLMRM